MIGRFQVMALLQAARAKSFGLSLDEAKSFGLNRAIFYAAAKKGFKGGSSKRQGGTMFVRVSPFKKDEKEFMVETVGDEKAFYVEENGKKYFVMGDELIKSEDFTKQVERRFRQRFQQAWREAMSIVEHTDKEILESQRKFYEQVYKSHRDELAAKWSDN